jgi:hypothetical protein
MADLAIVACDCADIPLTREYNVKALHGLVGIGGHFSVIRRHVFTREYFSLIPEALGIGEIDLNADKNKSMRAWINATAEMGLGKELDHASQYSVIRKLLSLVPEDDLDFQGKRLNVG